MQSADFEEDLYKKWFRRPTLFMACAWFLLAVAGRIVIRVGLSELALLMKRLGLTDVRGYVTAATDALYQMGVLALPVVWYAARHPGVDQSMRLGRPHPLTAVYALALAVGALPLATCLSGWWTLLLQSLGAALPEPAAAPSTPAGLAHALLLSALLPGLCEELMFRGGIFGAWERRGAENALVVSALMFAALHGSVQGLPTQLVMGFALGYIVLRSGSVWVGAIVHCAFNAAVLVLGYLLGGRAEMNIYAFISMPTGLSLFIADTVASAALFGLLLIGLKRLCEWRGQGGVHLSQPDPASLESLELVVLMAGIVTAAICYLEDVLSICGVL